LSSADRVPPPTDDVLIQLATLAAHMQEMLAADHPVDQTPVGLTTAKNQRRRAMETILVLLADAELRRYVSELERLGLVQVKRLRS
jgi:hypothetical protein